MGVCFVYTLRMISIGYTITAAYALYVLCIAQSTITLRWSYIDLSLLCPKAASFSAHTHYVDVLEKPLRHQCTRFITKTCTLCKDVDVHFTS